MNQLSEDPFIRGQWHAWDRVMNYLNTLDTETQDTTELKGEVYSTVMLMRPSEEPSRNG